MDDFNRWVTKRENFVKKEPETREEALQELVDQAQELNMGYTGIEVTPILDDDGANQWLTVDMDADEPIYVDAITGKAPGDYLE